MLTQMVLMFVQTQARLGNYGLNPYFFENININNLNLFIGARRIPASDYEINVTGSRTIRLFHQTQKALSYCGANNGPGGLDRSSFQDAAFIIVWDLSRDGNVHSTYLNSTLDARTIRLEGTFASETGADLYR